MHSTCKWPIFKIRHCSLRQLNLQLCSLQDELICNHYCNQTNSYWGGSKPRSFWHIVPSYITLSARSLARSLSVLDHSKSGSLHPEPLPPRAPRASRVLTWPRARREGKEPVRQWPSVRKRTPEQRHPTGLQPLTWPLWAAQTDGLSL